MIYERINNSQIAYNPNYENYVREYYNYCLGLVKEWLVDKCLNVAFGNIGPVSFDNGNRILKIDVQYEHTLVKEGGRSVTNIIHGNVRHENGYYLVRIINFDRYNSMDIVMDYSLSNIFNIRDSGKFNDFAPKVVYVPPTLYGMNFDNAHRKDVLALFGGDNSPRRAFILENLRIPYNKVTDCFSHDGLLELYRKSRIMVNVHQTDHHHTFEELRVLPAIMNGVLIVSEDSALMEKVPYHEYVIWSTYDDLIKTTQRVSENYGYYYNKVFGDGKLRKILSWMVNKSHFALESWFRAGID